MKAKVIALLIVIALAAVILLQNQDPTDVQILFWVVNAPLVVLILLMLVVGFAIGFIVAKLTGRRVHTEQDMS